MLSKAWPSPSAAYCLEATPPRAHHNDLTQMRKRPPKHDGKLRSFAQEEVAMPQACLVLVNKPLHPQLILRRTRHGVLAAKDSPIVLKCAVTSEFITSLKRSSTGVNCFLDTWTSSLLSGGNLLIPLFYWDFSHSGWILLVPFLFVFFMHCYLLSLQERKCLFWEISYVIVDGSMGRRGEGHPQHNCCQGTWIIMQQQHTHGLGHELTCL
jgi:hypothetical protein